MEHPNDTSSGSAAPILILLAVLVGLVLFVACGDGNSPTTPEATVSDTDRASAPRDESEAASALRAALDEGRADRAEELLEPLVGRLGVEEPCLRARLAFLKDDEGAWLRYIEDARAIDMTDPRPYATAAELWAAAGELEAALGELRRGVNACGGLSPELERAKGVLAIVTPGGGRAGLGYLERAVQRDPALPFVGRPLGQAHLLAAQAAMPRGDLEAALASIEKSLEYDPQDVDARDFHAQALYANDRYLEGLAGYEALLAEGLERVRPELQNWHKNFAFLAQIAGDNGDAEKHYLRALELGLPEHQLGSGAEYLKRRSLAALQRGVEHFANGDAVAAEECRIEAARLSREFRGVRRDLADKLAADAAHALLEESDAERAKSLLRSARWCDPEADLVAQVDEEMARRARNARADELVEEAADALREGDGGTASDKLELALRIDPENQLGRVLRGKLRFSRRDWGAAAHDFRFVVDVARAEGTELPEPVHLHLAACLDMDEDRAAALVVLEDYLTAQPEGRWLEDTRERLRLLQSR